MLGSFTGQRILINFNKPYFSLANINLGANYFMQTSFLLIKKCFFKSELKKQE